MPERTDQRDAMAAALAAELPDGHYTRTDLCVQGRLLILSRSVAAVQGDLNLSACVAQSPSSIKVTSVQDMPRKRTPSGFPDNAS